jgi:hypothetical protein
MMVGFEKLQQKLKAIIIIIRTKVSMENFGNGR